MNSTERSKSFKGKIEPAQLSDVTQLVRLETEVFGDRNPWSREAFKREIDVRPNGIWVIRDKARVVAYAQAQLGYDDVLEKHRGARDDDGLIGSIAVIESYRQRGLGNRLMSNAVDYLKKSHAARIVAQTNVGNEAMMYLLRKYGFQITRSMGEFYDNGEDGVEFELRLA